MDVDWTPIDVFFDLDVEGDVVQALDYVEKRFTSDASSLAALDPRHLLGAGLRVDIEIAHESWLVRATGQPRAGFSLSDNGLASDVFAEPDLTAARRAIEDGDLSQLLTMAPTARARVRLEYAHAAVERGYHWVPGMQVLMDILTGPSRLKTLQRFIDREPHVVVIGGSPDGADDALLETRGLRFTGRSAHLEPWEPEAAAPPEALLPVPPDAAGALADALRKLAFEAAWADMATSLTHPGDADPTMRIEGARIVEVPLTGSSDPDLLNDTISLWRWTTEAGELERRDATEHAASLAIIQPKDLLTAARRVLPTARSIYRLARQGVVAEALSARRAAREAGAAAARNTASSAIDTAAKARDRLVVQIAAVVGIAIANSTKVLDLQVSLAFLAVLAVIIAVIAGWALLIDLPASETALLAFKKDLPHYSDALAPDDVEDIAAMHVVQDAETHLRRSQCAIIVVTLLALSGVGAAAVLLVTTAA